MSYQCKAKLLKLTETPRPNVHYIFTSMIEEQTNSKEKAANTAAFGSRCEVFRFPDFTTLDVMKYLFYTLKELNVDVPDEFKTYGLQTIAQSSDGSLRKATQILQQCIDTQTYEPNEIKQNFGLEAVEDFYKTLLRLMNGDTSNELFNTLVNVIDYDGMKHLVKLDPKLSIKQNANKYYQSYSKKRKGKTYIEEQIEICQREIDYFDGLTEQLTIASYQDGLEIKEELARYGYLKKNKFYDRTI